MVVPGNKQRLPESLQRVPAIKRTFDHGRDPLVRAQLEDMEIKEYQRRQTQGRGSSMVRSDRPFPELRPKYERGPKRAAFNQAWLREQRTAVMARMEAQGRSAEESLGRSSERTGGSRQWSR